MTATVGGASAGRRGFGSLRLRGRIYWLRYRIDGKEYWESTHSTSRRKAEDLLAVRQDALGRGELTAPKAQRVGFVDLETMLRNHYRVHGLRGLPRLEGALTHLRAAFGHARAHAITADRIDGYAADRLDAGAARATVNQELAALRKAFNLAVRAKRLAVRPAISTPEPPNARTGFFEPDEFAALLEELPGHLKPVMQFAYLTGWRVRSEILPLTWDRVDFAAGLVRLDPNTTKTGKGRQFPFEALPELAALLRRQREETTALERATGSIIPFVFHRCGGRIKDYYHAWRSACRRAATGKTDGALAVIDRPQLMGRIAHDFRRTAVRNLVRAGVSEGVAMKLTGHRTREVFERYNITNNADLEAGVTKLAAHLAKSPAEDKGTLGGQSSLRLVSSAE